MHWIKNNMDIFYSFVIIAFSLVLLIIAFSTESPDVISVISFIDGIVVGTCVYKVYKYFDDLRL